MLTLRREWLLRQPLYLAVPLALALHLALPRDLSDAWALFCLLIGAPLLALGLGHTSGATPLWAALTPPRRLAAGQAVLHQALIALLACGSLAALLWVDRGGTDRLPGIHPSGLLLGLVLVAAPIALYLSAALAQSWGGGLRSLGGPLLLGAALTLSAGADWSGGRLSMVEGTALRLLLFGVAGQVTLIALADRRPSPALTLRLGLGAALLGALSLLPAQRWTGAPLLDAPRAVSHREGRTLYASEPNLLFGPRQAYLRDGQGVEPLGPPGVIDGALGPDGAIALVQLDGALDGPGALLLYRADGQAVRCPLARVDLGYRQLLFRADGGAVGFAQGGAGPSFTVLDVEGGCADASALPASGFVHDASRRPFPFRAASPDRAPLQAEDLAQAPPLSALWGG